LYPIPKPSPRLSIAYVVAALHTRSPSLSEFQFVYLFILIILVLTRKIYSFLDGQSIVHLTDAQDSIRSSSLARLNTLGYRNKILLYWKLINIKNVWSAAVFDGRRRPRKKVVGPADLIGY
jgi:hypothetical protein